MHESFQQKKRSKAKHSSTQSAPAKGSIFFSAFDKGTQVLIENGVYTLFNEYPTELISFTLTLPAESELTYLACCNYSDEIAQEFIQSLLPNDVAPLFVYRWERKRFGRLHLHLLVKAALERIRTARVNRVLFDVLEGLDQKTACNPFLNENGVLQPIRPETAQWKHYTEPIFRYPWTYWACRFKKGHDVVAGRELDCLDNAFVAPRSHGGVSQALADLVAATTYSARIPTDSRDSFETLVAKIKNDISANWQQGEYNSEVSCCLTSSDQLAEVTEYLRPWFDQSVEKTELSELPYMSVIMLTPNRRLKLYCHKRKREKFDPRADKDGFRQIRLCELDN